VCRDTWNSRLEFRLGHRVRDLYCPASDSPAADCPAVRAERAASKYPECMDTTITVLRRSNRLAFFPFDPNHRLLGFRLELGIWSVLLLLAGAGTAAWSYRMCRTATRPVSTRSR
jgi:hypothetical protein